MKLSRGKKLIFSAIVFVFVAATLETVSYVVCQYLQRKGVLYKPHFNETYGSYLEIRDPDLGWPSPGTFGRGQLRDVTGSRHVPAFPDPHKHEALVSIYGDSFTEGAEVSHSAAWGNLLAQKLGRRVANYGVGGYGSDQALLRFAKNQSDEASIVVLNHLSENILRNVNQYRQLLYPSDGLGFKPRFIIADDENLELIPLPNFSEDEYAEAVKHPEDYLEHEFYAPGGPSGTHTISPPYTWSMLAGLTHFHISAEIRGVPWYLEFYEANHPSNGLAITLGIMKEFRRTAKQRGQKALLTVIPTGLDLLHYLDTDTWPYQPLVDALWNDNIPVLDFGPGIIETLGTAEPHILFLRINGHYNEEGNRILSEIFYDYLQDQGLLQGLEAAGGTTP